MVLLLGAQRLFLDLNWLEAGVVIAIAVTVGTLFAQAILSAVRAIVNPRDVGAQRVVIVRDESRHPD